MYTEEDKPWLRLDREAEAADDEHEFDLAQSEEADSADERDAGYTLQRELLKPMHLIVKLVVSEENVYVSVDHRNGKTIGFYVNAVDNPTFFFNELTRRLQDGHFFTLANFVRNNGKVADDVVAFIMQLDASSSFDGTALADLAVEDVDF
jgi:hypothetical protein